MSERDIGGYCAVIENEILKQVSPDEEAIVKAAVRLLEGFLIDINRLAEASAIIAQEATK